MHCAPRRTRSLAVALALLLLPAAPRAEATAYQFGIIPQAPPVAMYERWGPVLARLSELTGATLGPRLYDNMNAFETDFGAGGPDFIFAHPAMMAAAHRAQGYVPLVRDRRELSGSIFVRADSPIRAIGDLEGKRIAFVGERSFCTVLVQLALSVEPMKTMRLDKSFHGSTRNVLRMVLLGKADAGASLDAALELEEPEMRELIRPLLTTPRFASHPIAAHPRVPAELRSKVADAVLAMARTEADRALLGAIRMPNPLLADYARDYRRLESQE